MALRVLFALLPILSCGFLGWGTMLRLAVVTRKPRDWWLLAVNCVLTVAWVALIGADPTPRTDGWQGNTGAFGVIITGFLTCVYFLVADIQHHAGRAAAPTASWYPAQPAPYVPPQHPQRPAYGYPPAQQQHHQQTPTPTPSPTPAPAPGPATPPRIGQVRAELDELSELLRKQTPHPHPNPNPNPQAPGNDGEGPAR